MGLRAEITHYGKVWSLKAIEYLKNRRRIQERKVFGLFGKPLGAAEKHVESKTNQTGVGFETLAAHQ